MHSETVVNKSISIRAVPSVIWNVLTKPEYMMQWLSETKIEVVSESREGGKISFTSNIYGRTYTDKGVILKFKPEKVFQYSFWTKISRLPDLPGNYSLIEFRLKPDQDQTLLELTHSNLIAKAAVEHSNFYWGVTLDVVRKLAESISSA